MQTIPPRDRLASFLHRASHPGVLGSQRSARDDASRIRTSPGQRTPAKTKPIMAWSLEDLPAGSIAARCHAVLRFTETRISITSCLPRVGQLLYAPPHRESGVARPRRTGNVVRPTTRCSPAPAEGGPDLRDLGSSLRARDRPALPHDHACSSVPLTELERVPASTCRSVSSTCAQNWRAELLLRQNRSRTDHTAHRPGEPHYPQTTRAQRIAALGASPPCPTHLAGAGRPGTVAESRRSREARSSARDYAPKPVSPHAAALTETARRRWSRCSTAAAVRARVTTTPQTRPRGQAHTTCAGLARCATCTARWTPPAALDCTGPGREHHPTALIENIEVVTGGARPWTLRCHRGVVFQLKVMSKSWSSTPVMARPTQRRTEWSSSLTMGAIRREGRGMPCSAFSQRRDRLYRNPASFQVTDVRKSGRFRGLAVILEDATTRCRANSFTQAAINSVFGLMVRRPARSVSAEHRLHAEAVSASAPPAGQL